MWRIYGFPRYRLISLPTPLEKADALSRELGHELYIKRDDVMELALGGNKVRKLEFLIGDALAKGCDVVITRGAFYSNHVRLTAAAARKAGLDVYLVLTPPGEFELQGNIVLNKLMGAEIVTAENKEEAINKMNELADELRRKGRKPYIIPGGGASPIGVFGYAVAAFEILQQLYSRGIKPKYIVHATGSGGTQAGLILGLKLIGADDVEVVGISVGPSSQDLSKKITELIYEAAQLLNVNVNLEPEDVIVIDKYIGEGYGKIDDKVVETMKYVAEKEALILDPVYTAKAMHGLIDLAHNGYFKKNSNIVFIHTGGIPIIFQTTTEIAKYL